MISVFPSSIVLIEPPDSEPISLEQAKEHLEVLHSDRDDMITAMITAAREYVELFTGRALVEQTLDAYYDSAPIGRFAIPRPPLRAVTEIFSRDSDGVETEILDDFTILPSEPAWLELGSTANAGNGIRIRFTAGYDDGEVPQAIKNALLMYVGVLFQYREQVSVESVIKMPWGAEQMLRQYRVEKALA